MPSIKSALRVAKKGPRGRGPGSLERLYGGEMQCRSLAMILATICVIPHSAGRATWRAQGEEES